MLAVAVNNVQSLVKGTYTHTCVPYVYKVLAAKLAMIPNLLTKM